MTERPMYHRDLSRVAAGQTTGRKLRITREMRGHSVDELAAAASLAPTDIAAAEADQHSFTVSEISRLALALDCHPSTLAFPEWELLPFAPKPVSVAGQVGINGGLEDATLRLYMPSKCGLWIQGPARKQFNLDFFTPSIASWNSLSDSGRAEGHFAAKGTTLGLCLNKFGGGAEPDTDVRNISKVELVVTPNRNGIAYQFSGLARVAPKQVRSGRPPDSPAGDWRFAIHFLVPADQLAVFLGLYPSAAKILIDKLSALAK